MSLSWPAVCVTVMAIVGVSFFPEIMTTQINTCCQDDCGLWFGSSNLMAMAMLNADMLWLFLRHDHDIQLVVGLLFYCNRS